MIRLLPRVATHSAGVAWALGMTRSLVETASRVVRTTPWSSGAAAGLLGIAATALPASTFSAKPMIWWDAWALALFAAALVAVAEHRAHWLTPLPALLAVAATTTAVLVRPENAALLVALVAILITGHLLAIDLVSARTGLLDAHAEAGALLAALVVIGLVVVVAELPPLRWLWLAGVGLAAAAAAYLMVAGQRR